MSVFGVSAQSMQCTYDDRGNSVPTILLMMQKRLYSGGGLLVSFQFISTIVALLNASHCCVKTKLRLYFVVNAVEGRRDISDKRGKQPRGARPRPVKQRCGATWNWCSLLSRFDKGMEFSRVKLSYVCFCNLVAYQKCNFGNKLTNRKFSSNSCMPKCQSLLEALLKCYQWSVVLFEVCTCQLW